jgi:molybdopterin molybdotransferase
MISVEEAKQLLFERVGKSQPVVVSLTEAFGCVLAEDIFSPVDLPSFNQSAMDGYAVASSKSENKKKFEVIGEIKAGDASVFNLQSGQAVRIFTGAAVPESAEAIVIQERVERVNGSIHLTGDFKHGDCIRQKGSQIKKGELALKENFFLNPAAIGFLAALGISKVKIFKQPEVSIIVTGNEIIKPGIDLKPREIYESNSFALSASLKQSGIIPKFIFTAGDNEEELKNKIEDCLADSDILLLTGGISVGKYDLVHDVLKLFDVETIFYKVAQKPGKPFFFGKLNDKLIFALPGNPAAVLVCFYEYVYPAIKTRMGFENVHLPVVRLNVQKEIIKTEDRALFIRAKKVKNGVLPLEKQDSNMLRSFAEADALIYVPNETKKINPGEEAEVHLLPFNF